MTTSTLEIFCRQIRQRSEENRKAFAVLFHNDIIGNSVSILRQELDSMIRVIYLLSIDDIDYRNELIELSVQGKKWTRKGNKAQVTDRDMVELANRLKGWTQSVYKFGCAFIHLSNFHDYQARDPVKSLTKEEKVDLLKHMRAYHGGPLTDDPSFGEVVRYLPLVFEKVHSNLECYVRDLEQNKVLDSS